MKSIRDIYNQTASDYIDAVGEEIQDYELPSLERFLELLPQSAKTLDIGCGSGKHADWLREKGCNIVGIDISDEMVKYVKNHFPDLRVLRGTLQDISEAGFDGIWCLRVFHHIPTAEQDVFLDKLHDLLVANGILYITAVHDGKNFEAYDSVNGALKKRLLKTHFHELMQRRGFVLIESKDWGNGHTQYFYRKKSD